GKKMQLTTEQKVQGRANFFAAAQRLPELGRFEYQPSESGPVRVGIVGTGVEGRVLIEVSNPQYLDYVACCDIRPDNLVLGHAQIVNWQHKSADQVRMYSNYEEMLNDPQIEAVVIATPLHLHGPMALQALEAGKHVFTEKTMAFTTELCEQMTQKAKEKG